jgi:tetratricopeptide (TPR) repeat protein
LDKAKKILP